MEREAKEKVLAKLARLKALSECKTGNAHEAAVAAAKMYRIMLENQIELHEVQAAGEASECGSFELFPGNRPAVWPVLNRQLLGSLASLNSCSVWAESRGRHRTFHLVGVPEDVANTRTLFGFALKEIERLASELGRHRSTAWKNDFKAGAAYGLVERLKEEKVAVLNENPFALVHIETKHENSKAAVAKITTKQAPAPKQRDVDPSAFQQGVMAGRRIDTTKRQKNLAEATA